MEKVYLDDSDLLELEVEVVTLQDGHVTFNRSIVFPGGGGQPRDQADILVDGDVIASIANVTNSSAGIVYQLEGDGLARLAPGMMVTQKVDPSLRMRHTKMHTALHLLCAAADLPVTGGQIADGKGRLDFDTTAGALDKPQLQNRIDDWIAADLPVTTSMIDYDELDRIPELVRTASVKPPRGNGRVRLVQIGDIDLQACGGTHVTSTTRVGSIRVGKIENKGRQNRRVHLHLET